MRKNIGSLASIAQTTLTPAFLEKVEHLLSRARYIRTVCNLLGVSRRSFYLWKKAGMELRMQYPYEELSLRQRALVDFCNAVERGIALGEMHDLEIIEAESRKNWRAAVWRLERRAPEHWSARRTSSMLDAAATNQLVARVLDALNEDNADVHSDDAGENEDLDEDRVDDSEEAVLLRELEVDREASGSAPVVSRNSVQI
ncbi:MAG: hypothetical protein AB7K24_29145 [Gemmataceae bacterium]